MSVACASFASPFGLRLLPLPRMATRVFRLAPFSCFEVSFAAPHAQDAGSQVRHLMQGPAIEAIRGRHGFTLATASCSDA